MGCEKTLAEARKKREHRDYFSATPLYEECVREMPHSTDVMFELATCYMNGPPPQYDAAANLLQRILQQSPNHYLVLNELGVCFNQLGRHKLALQYFRKAVYLLRAAASSNSMLLPPVQRDECIHLALNNIGQCCVKLKDYPAAENAYLEAVLMKPDAAASLAALVELHYYQKRYEQSLQIYKRHPELLDTPDHAYKKSFVLLATRRFEEGFRLYEHRLDNNYCAITNLPARVDVPFLPHWKGPANDSAKRILVIYEQGIGDNIMFFRFLLEMAAQHPELEFAYFCKPVVQHLFDISDVANLRIVQQVERHAFDAKVYIMSLPHLLGVREIHPCPTNYLQRNPGLEGKWAHFLRDLPGKRRVGFTLQGLLTASFIDKVLPLPEAEQQLFAAHPDVAFVSLQQETLYPNPLPNVHQLKTLDGEEPFADTVSLLHMLDLVITVDTAVAHLAGVAGVKTLLLLGQGSDWRWFEDNVTSSWYSNVNIVRAPQADFASVLPQASKWLSAAKRPYINLPDAS